MNKNAFLPADILLPDGVDMTKWSVIACDQFSSEPSYWDRVEQAVGDSPSALKLIVPEARLETIDPVASAVAAGSEMENYLKDGLFKTVGQSFIYLERTLSDGSVRRGLVGMLDLEAYDYRPGAQSAVRASEKTILSRLPARLEIRKRAALEMPHIMALIDDPDRRVIEPLAGRTEGLEPVYNFELMEGGGTVAGWRVAGLDSDAVLDGLTSLSRRSPVQIIIGDGNHSLAAARDYWDELRPTLDADARETHPARFALVELNNVYDPAIGFEPIHRLVCDTDPSALVDALEAALSGGSGRAYPLQWTAGGKTGGFTIHAPGIGAMIERLQAFLDTYVEETAGSIDYIHGERSLKTLSAQDSCIGFLMPGMDKSEFFATVMTGGVFPRKSFSIGNARDKRYYLECRAIRAENEKDYNY